MFTSCFIESLTDLLLRGFDSAQALLSDKLSVVEYFWRLIFAFESLSRVELLAIIWPTSTKFVYQIYKLQLLHFSG